MEQESVDVSAQDLYQLSRALRVWLGEEGRTHFLGLINEFGAQKFSTSVRKDSKESVKFLHPVHFREGMMIRNWMRRSGFCKDWSDYTLDNLWGEVVRLAVLCD